MYSRGVCYITLSGDGLESSLLITRESELCRECTRFNKHVVNASPSIIAEEGRKVLGVG